MILLYTSSSLLHGVKATEPTRMWLNRLDHIAIFLLIAGTYTPFALVTLRDTVGWWLFAATWTLAVIGIVLDGVRRDAKRIVPLAIYVAMGWLILVALEPLLAAIPPTGFRWLLAGGIAYSVGIIFFVLDHWYPRAHGIWHLFVLAGSTCHFFAVFLYVIPGAPAL